MNKIKTVSTYLIWAFNSILWGYPIFYTLDFVFKDNSFVQHLVSLGVFSDTVSTPEGLVHLSTLKFTPLSWTLGYLAGVIGFLSYFLILSLLKKIFRSYQQGSIFSFENAQKYKAIGGLLILQAILLGPLSNTLMVLSATLSNPPGHRYISIAFGTPGLADILCGLIIIVISWVMAESSKLQDDQELTI